MMNNLIFAVQDQIAQGLSKIKARRNCFWYYEGGLQEFGEVV